jgi:sortase B
MENNPKKRQETPKNGKKRKLTNLEWTLIFVAGVLLLVLLAMLILKPYFEIPDITPSTAPSTQAPTTTAPAVTETLPLETMEQIPLVMMEDMASLYAQNPDLIGWIKIEDTKIDYPVMYTPEDPEKYIHMNFKGQYSIGGLPFIDSDCSLDPESDNLIFYAHNMNNGTMFENITYYAYKNFWKEHPLIYFSTLYEERTYEVVAAFPDKVYSPTDDVFKFYQFIDAEDEEDFNRAVAYYKEKAKVDTGITPQYGDNLITLVTCAYHEKYGRFVVIARQVTPEVTTENAN